MQDNFQIFYLLYCMLCMDHLSTNFNNMDKYMFNNIIKIKKENSSSQKLLDEQWEHQKILLDYNILDFTCKNYYVYIIKYMYLYI